MIVTDNPRMLAPPTPGRDRDAALRVLTETVDRLAERIELLEARAALDAARTTARK